MSAINFLYKNKDFWTVILPFFIFIFFWDIKPDCISLENCVKDIRTLDFSINSLIQFEHFQLRYIIIVPFLRLLFSKKLKDIVKSLYLPFLIIVHLIIVKFIIGNPFIVRDYLSVLLLLIVYVATYNYRLIIIKNFHQIIKYFVIIFAFLFSLYFFLFFPYFVFNCYNGWFSQTRFLFLENSHFALMAAPVIIYYNLYFLNFENFSFKKNFELWFYCLFLIYSFINFSTTFLFGLILLNIIVIILHLFFFKNKNKYKIIFTSIFFIIISILIVINKSECKSRSFDILQNSDKYSLIMGNNIKNLFSKFQSDFLIFYNKKILANDDYILEKKKPAEHEVILGSGPNFSIAVILVNLQIASISAFNDPMGVGFNNYNFSHRKYATEFSNTGLENDIYLVNNFDAASNFSKIIAEFGVFGIFFLFYFFVCFFKNTKDKPINILVFSFLILQLIRGVGYFNGGFIVYVILYFFLIKKS